MFGNLYITSFTFLYKYNFSQINKLLFKVVDIFIYEKL